MDKLTVVKVGGKIVENEASLQQLLDGFATLDGPKVLVHGGGRTATDLATRMGIETQMVDGRRITDADMLSIVTMVYGGLVNKHVVAALQSRGIQALGLTGADMDVIRSHRRAPNPIDFGFVGDVDRVNADALCSLIGKGITPVMAPLTHDGQGQLLNTNADTIAGETAKALASHYEVTLIYCFEHAGVLRTPKDENSVISHINAASFEALVTDGTISGGMIPKIQNSLQAVAAGVKRVIITRADLLTQPDRGTVID